MTVSATSHETPYKSNAITFMDKKLSKTFQELSNKDCIVILAHITL